MLIRTKLKVIFRTYIRIYIALKFEVVLKLYHISCLNDINEENVLLFVQMTEKWLYFHTYSHCRYK